MDEGNKSCRFFCISRKHSKWIKCHEILNGSQSHTHHAAAPTKHLSLSVFPDSRRGSSGHLETKHQHSKSIFACACACVLCVVCLYACVPAQNLLTQTEKQSFSLQEYSLNLLLKDWSCRFKRTGNVTRSGQPATCGAGGHMM